MPLLCSSLAHALHDFSYWLGEHNTQVSGYKHKTQVITVVAAVGLVVLMLAALVLLLGPELLGPELLGLVLVAGPLGPLSLRLPAAMQQAGGL